MSVEMNELTISLNLPEIFGEVMDYAHRIGERMKSDESDVQELSTHLQAHEGDWVTLQDFVKTASSELCHILGRLLSSASYGIEKESDSPDHVLRFVLLVVSYPSYLETALKDAITHYLVIYTLRRWLLLYAPAEAVVYEAQERDLLDGLRSLAGRAASRIRRRATDLAGI